MPAAAEGLSEAEVRARLARHGPNQLAPQRREPLWEAILEELREPMILLLLVTGGLYALLGEPGDAATIFVIIIALLSIEITNERRAGRAVEALRDMAEPCALVRRGGQVREIPAAEVVPGDLLLLQAGRRVPADARLLESYGLAADESALTGESAPVEKQPGPPDAAHGRSERVFAGTVVVRGRGAALVTATGPASELGQVAELARAAKPPRTALQQAMRALSGALVWVALGFSLLVPLLGVLLAGQPPAQMLLTGLALAFATIPEELPIIITMVLALGSYRLAHQRAIVKRLQAIESLGALTLIATDKTGTLTENRMRVVRLEPPERAADLLRLGVLGSAGAESGDPLEAALEQAARAAGLDPAALRGAARLQTEHTFDATRRMMSLVYAREAGRWVVAKGAPEVLLEQSAAWAGPQGPRPLDPTRREALRASAAGLAEAGLRVLALAERGAGAGPLDREQAEQGLTFVGLVGFADPPRPEAAAAVADCRRAGIRTLMITGDHPLTARAVAGQVGLETSALLSGAQIDDMSDSALERAVAEVNIYARATPAHKLRIVQALQRRGERVAVTGDGINDAPALAAADVGVAMGASGTDVARAAADMVLADDNFATIVRAVREGRVLLANLRKGLRYYLACKVALIGAALLPTLLGLPTPFAPVQIILMELFMDLAASVAFVAEPAERDVMARRPRDPRAPFLDRGLAAGILAAGLGLCAAVVFAYQRTLAEGAGLAAARTAAFLTWMLGHVLLALNLRAERAGAPRALRANRVMLGWALATAVFVLLVGLAPPLQSLLKATPLSADAWLRCLAAALLGTCWLTLLRLARPLSGRPAA